MLFRKRFFSKIELIKKADSLIGRIAANLLPPPENLQLTRTPQSILLIRPGGIGDAVHLIPSILAIKKTFPACRIDILAEKRNYSVFGMLPFEANIWCYDDLSQLASLLKLKYDVVIDTEQWHRMSAVIARFVKSSVKIGFATNERKRLFSHPVQYDHERYEVKSFLDLLKPLSIETFEDSMLPPFLKITKDSMDKADNLLLPVDGSPFVVFFTGASIEERKWGVVRFARAAQLLIERGRKVVCIGGMGEVSDSMFLKTYGVLTLAGETTLAESSAVISRAQVILSGDSGILHLAAAVGIPTVSLFGSGRWKKWAPRGASNIVLKSDIPCSPCTTFGYTPECSKGSECMRLITVESAVNAIESLIA